MTAQRYATKRVDHLGLVSGFCREIGLVELIDSYFPNQTQNKHVSYGQCVLAMLLNGLGFVGRTPHMYGPCRFCKVYSALMAKRMEMQTCIRLLKLRDVVHLIVVQRPSSPDSICAAVPHHVHGY